MIEKIVLGILVAVTVVGVGLLVWFVCSVVAAGSPEKSPWTYVENNALHSTATMRVSGGVLYRVSNGNGVALCFVPDTAEVGSR